MFICASSTLQHVSPLTERTLHTLSLLSLSSNTPHLLASFQSSYALHLVLDYIPNGTLWDLLSSLPSNPSHPSGLAEDDVRFWSLSLVSALAWIHEQGWAHRDVKPHNLLVDARDGQAPRVLLTDFGSAAKVSKRGGSRLLRRDCLWLVGTPDYIAPEVLEANEEALVRAEEEEEEEDEDGDGDKTIRPGSEEEEGYGVQIDWWSMGVVI